MRFDKKAITLLLFVAGLFFSLLPVSAQPPSSEGEETVIEEAPPPFTRPPEEMEERAPRAPAPPQMPTPVETPPPDLRRPTEPAGAEKSAVDVKEAPTADGEEEKVYLNVHEADIKDVIKQISKATARNFIIDDKIRGKVSIISQTPMTREQAYQAFLSALEVAGFTTIKGPANVIKVVPLKEAAQSPIPTYVDSTPYTDSFVTRLITLENISALDMSNAIKDLVSRDGNLFAYPATNTLIITDSGSNIDRIMKIVKELDQEEPQQVMEIIPILNALATDIATMVQELFEEEKARAGAARGKGTQPQELEGVSKIIPDERTNSIIVLASKRAIENVRAVIKRLDSKLMMGEEGRIHVYYLKHAKAKDLAETLSSLTSAAGKTKDKKAGASGGTDIAIAQFEGGIKITADEATNSLIVTALPKDFKTLIDKVISKLDIPRPQVYFEAIIMEMTLSKGVEYGANVFGGAGAGGGLIGMGQTLGAPSTLGGLIAGAAKSGPAAWPAFLGGLISSRTTDLRYVGADGKAATLTVPAFSAFLSALATRGEANIISMPNLLTLDNEEASMKVLSKEPTPGSTTFTSAATTATSVDYKEAGLELKIKPQISEGDMIVLEIEQKLSGFSTPKFSSNLNAPAMTERSVKTTVVTENGQTVVLAGLMEDSTTQSKRKVPLLGDIPLLGLLFSTTQKQASKSNLLIFITPHIIKDRTDFTTILKRKIDERNRFIDTNFSKSKRQQIREAITTHREDLLEFREPIALEPGAEGLKEKSLGSAGEIKKEKAEQKAPVITVPEKATASKGPMIAPPVLPVITPAPKVIIPEPVPEEKLPPPVKEEKKVKPKASLPPPPEPVVKEEPIPSATPPPVLKEDEAKKKKKKEVIPPPPVATETVPPSKEAKSAPTEEAQKPVVTVPKAPVEEGKKEWKKPAPASRNGSTDLTY